MLLCNYIDDRWEFEFQFVNTFLKKYFIALKSLHMTFFFGNVVESYLETLTSSFF